MTASIGTGVHARVADDPALEPDSPLEDTTRDATSSDLEFEQAVPERFSSIQRTPVSDLGEGKATRRYLIRLEQPAVPTYEGGISDLIRTAPRGAERLDAEEQAVVDYRQHLERAQVETIESIERALGRQVEVPFTYQFAVNGFTAVLAPDEARAIARLPSVVDVRLDEEREPDTDRGPLWINADAAWNGTSDLGLPDDYRGEGIVIGVIDTGISPGNDSFSDVGGDGYDHDNPLGSGNYLGVCNEDNPVSGGGYDPDFPCNDKLIGAYDFTGEGNALGTIVGLDEHGTHTASTAGGNVVFDVEVQGPGITDSLDITGVAPHANIVAYRGCCSVSSLTAAIDQAIADGVDVLNYSISSQSSQALWHDFDTLGFLNARAAGIFVAASAGNQGPGGATTGGTANSPWITGVASSTHDRRNRNSLIDLTSSAGGLDDIEGVSVTGAVPSGTPIISAGSVGDAPCNNSAGNEAQFNGRIVVCMGADNTLGKSMNVSAQGAVGVIAIDTTGSGVLTSTEFDIPGATIALDDGLTLEAWLADGVNHTAGLSGTEFVVSADYGNLLAHSSSRGPNSAVDSIAPSVVAPGVNILAGVGVNSYTVNDHDFMSGTSMASPHVAGAAALIRQARPDWTPAEIQSALMTTAGNQVRDFGGESATPYEQGAGLVDVGAALRAGLLFDESIDAYLGADPSEGGDPRTLNLPSFSDTGCFSSCSWTRTAVAPASAPPGVEWTATTDTDPGLDLTVELSDAIVSAGETIEISVTASVDESTQGSTVFGWVTLEPDNAEVPTVTMPVAVAYTSAQLVDELEIRTRRSAGSRVIRDLRTIEITQLETSAALERANEETFELQPDPTPAAPYDDPSTNEVILVDVPAGTRFLVAETLASSVPDLNLFVGTGSTPTAGSQACQSTRPGTDESCWVENPAEGQWWIMAQSSSTGSPPPVGDVELAISVLPTSPTGNVGVEGPVSNPVGLPFDLTVHWDEADAAPGDRYYGYVELGTDPANPGNIGTVPLTFDRLEDDVSKVALDDQAIPGGTAAFAITIQPNFTSDDLVYSITDTVPDGFTIDEASVTHGGVVDGQTVTWSIEMPTPLDQEAAYVYTTSLEDATCQSPLGGYYDLKTNEGFAPDQQVFGEDGVFTYLSDEWFHFFGGHERGLGVTPFGLVLQGGDRNLGVTPFFPQTIPDSAAPNGLVAPFWSDTVIIAEDGPAGSERGITVASTADLAVVEFDRLQMFGSPGEVLGSYQLVTRRVGDPDGPHAWIVFGEPGFIPSFFTVGIENPTGERATRVDEPIQPLWEPGNTVCLDYTGFVSVPETLTYEVGIDPEIDLGIHTNRVVHITEDPFAEETTTAVDIEVIEPEPPSNQRPPVIDGTAQVGATVSVVDLGDWEGVGLEFSYRWLLDGEPIDEAVEATYVVAQGDAGSLISVEVTATDRFDRPASAESNVLGPVSLPPLPSNTAPPTIEGAAVVGESLTVADHGEWNGAGLTFSYQWLADGDSIEGATGTQLVLTEAELGASIVARVTASDPFDRSATAVSNPLGPVEAAPAPPSGPETGPDLKTESDDLWLEPDADFQFDDVPPSHLFEYEIEWLAANDITRGCNPPENLFCPNELVTRGQVAAFLVRSLDLTDTDGTDFTDDDDSIFERDIEKLAAAGITRGCNPPANDRFCPEDGITRGQAAAFLARAFALEAGGGTDFTDDDDSIFERDIEKLAAAGITRGCNPPANDRFCPEDGITRGQMAVFLFRLLTR